MSGQPVDPVFVVACLSGLAGRHVTITIADVHTGWQFVSLTGVAAGVDLDPDCESVELTLAAGAGTVRLFGDMIDAIDLDGHEVRVSYRAGDVTILVQPEGPIG